jgi:hypothetical protein
MGHKGTPNCISDQKTTIKVLFYRNFDDPGEKNEYCPPIGNLSAKRLGEGGTQAFDIHKYSIYLTI